MPVTCTFCRKNYPEKVARCPFCNTPGSHAPPPAPPTPSLTPAAAAAAQDPELKRKMVLNAIEAGRRMRDEPPGEYAHTSGGSFLQEMPAGTKAAIVMGVMAALNAVIGLFLLAIPAGDRPAQAMEVKIMGVAGLATGLLLGGLAFGAHRGKLVCVWIGATLYLFDLIYMLTHGALPGAMIKAMILVGLVKLGMQMKEELE